MNPEDNKIKPVAQQGQAAVDKAASATKDAIGSTQQAADRTMNKVSDKIDEARGQIAPTVDKMSDMANSAMTKARETWQDASGQVKEQAKKASEMATLYAKDEPIKAMLIAAATGALLMGLLTMMARSRD